MLDIILLLAGVILWQAACVFIKKGVICKYVDYSFNFLCIGKLFAIILPNGDKWVLYNSFSELNIQYVMWI